jgi:hypothetical protein
MSVHFLLFFVSLKFGVLNIPNSDYDDEDIELMLFRNYKTGAGMRIGDASRSGGFERV